MKLTKLKKSECWKFDT